jgi:predicted flavoprotein YhiN
MKICDTVVIGAGAAGLMCAIEAGKRGRQVVVLDHAEAVGKKILISGGGRCNFTNLHAVPDLYISENPHFAISALSRYTSADFIEMVERYGIKYHEKKLGQLFCDGGAGQTSATSTQSPSSSPPAGYRSPRWAQPASPTS